MAHPKSGYRLADGTRVPGVTTIIGRFKASGGLIHWAWGLGMQGIDYRAARDSAAASGTVAHDMIEADLKGEEWVQKEDLPQDVVEKARVGFGRYKQWAAQSKLEVLETETPMVSELHRFGGCPDAIGYVNGELCVLDWKTGNSLYADQLIQVVAYKHLYEENNPDTVINGGIHICRFSKEYADFEHRHFASDLGDAWTAFLQMRSLYDLMAKLEKRVK